MTVLMIRSVLTLHWASNAVVLLDLQTWMEMEETVSVGIGSINCLSMCVMLADINECLEDPGSCDANALCINTVGSFQCICVSGFTGNGRICTGMGHIEFSVPWCSLDILALFCMVCLALCLRLLCCSLFEYFLAE